MVLCAWSSLTNPTWLFSTFQIFFAATWRSLDRKPKISILVGTVYQGSKFLRTRGCHPDIEGRGLAVSRRWPHSALVWDHKWPPPSHQAKIFLQYLHDITHNVLCISNTATTLRNCMRLQDTPVTSSLTCKISSIHINNISTILINNISTTPTWYQQYNISCICNTATPLRNGMGPQVT